MKKDLDYFIDKRAEDLAVMHMTRHQDIRIERCTDNVGLDMLATIVRDHHPTGRMFGLQVRGEDRAIATLKEITLATPLSDFTYLNDLPFPVCKLFFTMEDDRGYYRWIKPPTHQIRSLASDQTWNVLDQAELEQMFMSVNRWYDEKIRAVA